MEKESTELTIWLKTFTIFVSAIASAVVFFLYINRYIIFNRAAARNASLTFATETLDVQSSTLLSTQVMINTDTALIKGTDVRIKFDRSKLELIHVLPKAQTETTLKTYLPLNGAEFDMERVVRQANETGFVEFSAITADINKQSVTASFKGIAILAQLTFRSIQPGKTSLVFVNAHPTHDSTIIQDLNPPINILSRTNQLTVTSVGVFPTPSPRLPK